MARTTNSSSGATSVTCRRSSPSSRNAMIDSMAATPPPATTTRRGVVCGRADMTRCSACPATRRARARPAAWPERAPHPGQLAGEALKCLVERTRHGVPVGDMDVSSRAQLPHDLADAALAASKPVVGGLAAGAGIRADHRPSVPAPCSRHPQGSRPRSVETPDRNPERRLRISVGQALQYDGRRAGREPEEESSLVSRATMIRMSRMSRRTALLAAVLAAATTALCGAAPAATSPAGDGSGSGWPALSRRIAEHWPGVQNESGAYFDPGLGCAGCARYGEAFLAYGLLLNGVRDDDEAMVRSAMHAIDYAIAKYPTPPQGCPDGSPFEDLALAASYNLMRRNPKYGALFAPRRAAWAEHLRRVQWRRIGGSRYCNKTLVESVMGRSKLLRTGLTCTCPGAVLQTARGRSPPSSSSSTTTSSTTRRCTPGRSVAGCAGSCSPIRPAIHEPTWASRSACTRARSSCWARARRRARGACCSTWPTRNGKAAAPNDGATAYWGRSQEEAWAASLTAYGAEMAARLARSARARARYVALANREIDRIELVHGFGGIGLNIVPAAREDPTAVRRVDEYASNIPYIGLTLVGLDWAIAARTPGRGRRRASRARHREQPRARHRLQPLRRRPAPGHVVRDQDDVRLRADDLAAGVRLPLRLRPRRAQAAARGPLDRGGPATPVHAPAAPPRLRGPGAAAPQRAAHAVRDQHPRASQRHGEHGREEFRHRPGRSCGGRASSTARATAGWCCAGGRTGATATRSPASSRPPTGGSRRASTHTSGESGASSWRAAGSSRCAIPAPPPCKASASRAGFADQPCPTPSSSGASSGPPSAPSPSPSPG